MDAFSPDELPVGIVRVDESGMVMAANAFFCEWAENASPAGRPLSDFMVPVEDFLNVATNPGMMARPDRHDRAAFILTGADGFTHVVIDASARYAAGQALQDARSLSDRTRARLQLVMDASIAFAQATTEQRLAEILAGTAAQAYQAEESAVYLADEARRLTLAFGTNPLDSLASSSEASFDVVGLHDVLKISTTETAASIAEQLPEAMAAVGVEAIIAAPIHLEGETLGIFACFFHHTRQFDGEAAPLAEALAGQAARTLTSIRLQHQLEHAAMHDDTTGLPNRRRLEEQVSALADGRSLAVMFVDLDGFKAINDQLGHPRGDEVLREVARRLQATMREQDLIARYGGDEFIVVCDMPDALAIAQVAERLRLALQGSYPFLPPGMSLSASIGVATGSIRQGALSIDRLIRTADQAMYAAKMNGGNRVVGP